MSLSQDWKSWKASLAFIFAFATIITTAFYASRPAPPSLPQSIEIDPEMDLSVILKRSLMVQGTTSADLFKIRQADSRNIVPPSDREKASALLAECESLWNELLEIMDDPAFRKGRFFTDRYDRWRERAEMLHANRPDKTLVGSDIHRLTDRLLGVANDYVGIPDYPSNQAEWFENFHLPLARKAVQTTE